MDVGAKAAATQSNDRNFNHLFDVWLAMRHEVHADRHIQMVVARQVGGVHHLFDHLLGLVSNCNRVSFIYSDGFECLISATHPL